MTTRDVLLILCSVGGAQSIFMGINFLFFERTNGSINLLGGLFLMLGIRVIKSTLYIFTDDVPLWFINIGFAAHYCVGPLLLLFVLSLTKNGVWKGGAWIHFIPGLAIVVLSNWLTIDGFWFKGGYSALLIQSIGYIALAILATFRFKAVMTVEQYKWSLFLITGVFVFVFIYFSNYILRLNPYFLAPVIYAGVVYLLSFYIIKRKGAVFQSDAKYKNIKLDDEQASLYTAKIMEHYQINKAYLNNDYSLTRLSEEIKVPKHLLSLVFSTKMEASFVDFTNKFRVDEAKELLATKPNHTISSIAFDCGFNSVSSFNQAFKKNTKTTPSVYKKSVAH